MANFIVARNSKLNNKLSLYFFVLVVVLGMVGAFIFLSVEKRTRDGEILENLERDSYFIYENLKESLDHKRNVAISANILVRELINNPSYFQKSNIEPESDRAFRGLDGRSGVFITHKAEYSDELVKEVDSTNYIWSVLPFIILNEFSNYWYISDKGFLRIMPSKWAFEIDSREDFSNNIYYLVGTPDRNPEMKPVWTPVYYDTTIKRWMTSLIIPVYKDNIFLGVTGSDLYLDNLLMEYEGLNYVVLNGSNNTIYNSNNKNLNPLEDHSVNKLDSEYQSKKFTFSGSDWSIVFYIDRFDQNISERDLEANLIITILLVAIFIYLVSWFVIRRSVISPLNKLSLAASDFNFSSEIELISKRNDEIGTLSKSFMVMGDTIKNQIREIKLESLDRIESEKKFRRLIENLGKEYFFYSFSTNNNFTYVSESVEQMLGFSPDEFISNFTEILVESEKNYNYLEARAASIKGIKQPGYNVELFTSDKNRKLIELVETPIFNNKGHVISVEGIAHDITEIKKAEDELKEHKENLQDIVANRTKELENTLVELVETKKMASLGELVSGVAHEINTPVGIGVTASTHLSDITNEFEKYYFENRLSKSKFEKFINEMKQTSKIILTNMIKAASLIKGFKEISVDQTSNDIRTFNFKDYIDEVILSIHSELKHTKHKIVIDVDCGIKLTTYPGALSQVLTNLIFNTLIHGFEDLQEGEINIIAKDSGSMIDLIYKDNGKGIPEEVLQKIYNPFFTTKRGKGGSGLGMNIVFNLVSKTLRGTIKCSSELNKGVTFTINFPKNIKESK